MNSAAGLLLVCVPDPFNRLKVARLMFKLSNRNKKYLDARQERAGMALSKDIR